MLTNYYKVACDTCSTYETLSSKEETGAEKEAKKNGWELSEDHWYCTTCTMERFKTKLVRNNIPLTTSLAHERIIFFIAKRGYSYTVEDILETYTLYYKKGSYISHTASDCVAFLENELEFLFQEQQIS